MQDRYTGDIGDFGKYGLLKELAAPNRAQVQDRTPLRLGVIWCRTLPEKNTDGGHTEYLTPTQENHRRFRACDPELYDILREVVRRKEREVASIQRRRVLPPHTAFFSALLTFDGLPRAGRAAQAARLARRSLWLERALVVTRGCDFVFFDPDNGLPATTRPHHHKGPKFIFYEELEPFIARGQAMVIYQHAHRRGTLEEQLQSRFVELEDRLGLGRRPFACVFRRRGVRSFIIVPAGTHGPLLIERARAFVRLAGWRDHWSLAEPGCQ